MLGAFDSGSIKTHTYLCVDCGYVEKYLLESDSRQELAKKWPRVGDEKDNLGDRVNWDEL
jgi:hypothetical protein